MKILDVDLLQDGLKRNMAMLERLKTETENIERTVSGLVEMDELLKGEGGYAIRDFYAECHLPFLQFFQLFSETYRQKLQQIESALQSLEPDSAGYIMQEFLEGELEQGLTLIGNLTEALTNEANSIMDSVSDIVSLPHLDDSAVQEGVITSKKKRDDTLQQLNEFDYSQTVSLNPVEQDIQTIDTWLTDIEGMFQSGLTDVHFQSPQWRVNPSRKRLIWELATRESVLPKLKKYALTEELSSMLQTYLEGVSPISFGLGGQISSPNVFIGPAMNRVSTGNQFNLSHLKNILIPSVEQLISATEAETLISKAVDEKQVFDDYVSFPEVSTIQGKYYTLPDGRILRQYYGKTGAYEYKYVNSIPEDQLGDSKTLEDIFPAITVMDEFLVGDIITMVENPSPGPIAEAALFTVVKPLKIIDKINDGFKDGKKIEKIDGKGIGKETYQHLKDYKNNKYFTLSVEYNAGKDGTGFTYKVYQRGDIDWDMVRTKGSKKGRGLTNAEASAKHGLAPILDDTGSVATLHHSQQKGVGPLYEASTRYHNISNAKRAPLHPYKGKLNPFYPMDETTRGAFQKVDSINYWKTRGEEALGGK